MPPAGPLTRDGSDLLLAIRLTPKAAMDRLDGVEIRDDGRAVLKVRVRAVPESGKANEALLRLLAKSLDVPLRALDLASGATARIKLIRISDAPDDLPQRLDALVGRA